MAHWPPQSSTGEEKILPVVAWGAALLSYTLPLLMDILIGVTVSSCLKIVSGVPGERIRESLWDFNSQTQNIYRDLYLTCRDLHPGCQK